MGVEPTGAGIADAHTVLKTGEATRPHPPPSSNWAGSIPHRSGAAHFPTNDAITSSNPSPYFSALVSP